MFKIVSSYPRITIPSNYNYAPSVKRRSVNLVKITDKVVLCLS
jgi:hypothetical protein